MAGSATFSADQRYRYLLRRWWGGELFQGKHSDELVCWVMLNPSTATADVDDPTIRRCIGFSKAWGYGGLHVVNLFAWRSTDPSELLAAEEPTGGATNDEAIVAAGRASGLVVAAWGAVHPSLRPRMLKVVTLLHDKAGLTLHHIGQTQAGLPRHPLYVAGAAKPEQWRLGGVWRP